jgi:L-alanine-DL-glutamate epimerase-like enolase superfamily enzyme
MRELTVARESWPIRGRFAISRGAKTSADVVVAEVSENGHIGRGECVPYARYGETMDSVESEIENIRPDIVHGLDRDALQGKLPCGAARNAVDCALWDLEAKASGNPVWRLAGLDLPGPATTAFTLSLDTPEGMAREARRNADRPILKLKLGADGVIERVRAVRDAAPRSRLIVDANEAWTVDRLIEWSTILAELRVEMVEQPLPAQDDAALDDLDLPVDLCADESCHDTASLDALIGRYGLINIKLDKTGGLTEALRLARSAREMGFAIMVGCMVATSLSMAPAMLIAGTASFVDLDGPLLLERDRPSGLSYRGSTIDLPEPALWG